MRCIVVPNLTLLRSQWLRRHSIPFFAAPMVTTCAGKRRSLQRAGPTLRRRAEEFTAFPVFYAVIVF